MRTTTSDDDESDWLADETIIELQLLEQRPPERDGTIIMWGRAGTREPST